MNVQDIIYLRWLEEYSIGNGAIDNQHKKIVVIINQLYRAVRRDEGERVLAESLGYLIDYTKQHFATEEAIFQGTDFPEIEAHLQLHTEMTARTLEIQKTFFSFNEDNSLELLHFLKEWWFHHITGDDRKYIPYIQTSA